MRVHPLTQATMLAFCSAALVACGGDDDSNGGGGSTDTTAEVRVVHASANAPNVNAGLNGGGQVSDLAYANATGFLGVEEGDYDVAVDGILPDGSTTTVIDAPGVTLDADNETSIFAVGNVGGSGDTAIGPLVVTAPDEDPASDKVRVQVAHASAAAEALGKLDVYVTAPGANLSDSSVDPVGTFEFKGDLGPITVDQGDYRIRVTPQGSPGDVRFDSGTVNLPGGSDLLLAAIDSAGPTSNASPVQLLQIPEGGSTSVIRDQGSNTSLRAAHLSTNAPSTVDIEVNGSVPGALDDVSFPTLSSYLSIPSGTTDVAVLQSDGTSLNLSASLSLAPQSFNTAYAINDGNGSTKLITTEDDLRSVATEVRFRVVHAASNVTSLVPNGEVDVYVLPDGTTPSEAGQDAAAIESLAFEDSAEAAAAGGNTYDVFVTPKDTPSDVRFERQDLAPSDGQVFTLIARDDKSQGSAVTVIEQNDTQ